jgi:hypothetical protein
LSKKGGNVQPVDPVKTAQAQSQANIETAREQQRLNMINTSGPQGAVTYQADPNAPGGYSQTTTLSPAEQAIYDKSKAAESGALDTATTQLGRVNDALATPLSTEGLPQLSGGVDLSGLHPGQIQSSFNTGQPLQYSFNPGQAVLGDVGGDLGVARQQAIDAVYGQATSRLDPRFAQDENALRTKLANQGLSQNDTAYQTALQNFQQGRNDAYNQAQYSAIGAGEDAATALFGRQVQQGQFHNQAANQQYAQNQGQAAFHNATAGQDFGQNQSAAQFANAAEAQRFGEAQSAAQTALQNAQLQNTARQQGLQERAYIQNTPINQFTGLLGLGQVGMPQGIQYSPTQVAPTDVLGAYALNQQGQLANAQMKQQANSGLMGGLFSLGSAAMMASDRRLKTDVHLIRRRKDGVGVYRFRYIGSDVPHIGVMAQELKKVRPDLVVKRADGFLAVDYSALDLEAA